MARLYTKSKFHRTLNGLELVRRREKAGLTQTAFARMCGWSQQFQSRIESPAEHEVHIAVIRKIRKALKA